MRTISKAEYFEYVRTAAYYNYLHRSGPFDSWPPGSPLNDWIEAGKQIETLLEINQIVVVDE